MSGNRWAEHWPEIDRWRYEEGLTYAQIQDRCDELFGRHPSKGTLSPHFSQQLNSILRCSDQIAQNYTSFLHDLIKYSPNKGSFFDKLVRK